MFSCDGTVRGKRRRRRSSSILINHHQTLRSPVCSLHFNPSNSSPGERLSSKICRLPHSVLLGDAVGTEVVMVDDIPFPPQVTLSPSDKPLSLLGHGTNDLEIHFIQVKFTAIGIYLDPQIISHLQPWKAKKATDLAVDDTFFQAVISSPVDKFVRVVVIKEIKGSQYGLQLENAVRDGLVAIDKYEDEEEEALQQVVEFFQHHYFKKGSIVTFYFPAASAVITLSTEGKENSKFNAENANVVDMIKKWYMGGTSAVSPTTISSLAHNLSAELSK